MPVSGDLAAVSCVVRRLHLRDRVEGREPGHSGHDHGLERRVVGGERRALDQDRLAGRLLEVFVEDRVGASRLAGSGRLEDDLLERRDEADCEQHHSESEPAEDRLLSVVGAPARHARSEIRPADSLLIDAMVRGCLLVRLVLDDPGLHGSLLSTVRSPPNLAAVTTERKTGDLPVSGGGFLVSCDARDSGAQVEQNGQNST